MTTDFFFLLCACGWCVQCTHPLALWCLVAGVQGLVYNSACIIALVSDWWSIRAKYAGPQPPLFEHTPDWFGANVHIWLLRACLFAWLIVGSYWIKTTGVMCVCFLSNRWMDLCSCFDMSLGVVFIGRVYGLFLRVVFVRQSVCCSDVDCMVCVGTAILHQCISARQSIQITAFITAPIFFFCSLPNRHSIAFSFSFLCVQIDSDSGSAFPTTLVIVTDPNRCMLLVVVYTPPPAACGWGQWKASCWVVKMHPGPALLRPYRQ
jgi:hypothetical protein